LPGTSPDNRNEPLENTRRRIVIPIKGGKKGNAGSSSSSFSFKRTIKGPARQRSILGKIVLVAFALVVIVVLLAAGGGFFWWQHYKTTPAYSLAVLVDAAQRNDMATVQSIIDTDQVVQNFAGEVTEKAASRYGGALGNGAREQIQALTPALLPRIKESVSTALAERVKEISSKADHKPFILVALGLPYLVDVAVTGDSAKATTLVENQTVELQMSRADERWKIVAYRDEALVQRAIDQVIKDLPAVGVSGDKKPAPRQLKGLPRLREPKLN
jgi:hypothetical protein